MGQKTVEIKYNNHNGNGHSEVAQFSMQRSIESIWHHPVVDTVLFSNLLNVIIVVIFLVWLIRKFNVLSFIGKRREEIIESIQNAESEKNIKENELEETRKKVGNVKQEVTKIVDQGEEIAAELSEKVLEEAEQEASDIQKKAQASIENERKVAANDVASKVTEAAFILAEEHIKSAIDMRLHKKFIDEFIENIDEKVKS